MISRLHSVLFAVALVATPSCVRLADTDAFLCHESADCLDGLACLHKEGWSYGYCGEAGADCLWDEHCETTMACLDEGRVVHRCVERGTLCADDDGCKRNQRCDQGACEGR